MSFKSKYSHTQRLAEALRVISKHPDKIPIICEPINPQTPNINRSKYLVSGELTVGQLLHIIRPRIENLIHKNQALFLFVSNNRIIPATSSTVNDLYDRHKDTDGFLYINFSLENTFGCI